MTAADDQNQHPMLELDGIKKYFTQNSGVIDRVLGDVSTVRRSEERRVGKECRL